MGKIIIGLTAFQILNIIWKINYNKKIHILLIVLYLVEIEKLKCNVDYYKSLLSIDENQELLLVTLEKYHCPQFINEKKKCIKCH